MYYYLIKATTPYVGTDNYEMIESATEMSESELDSYCDDFASDNASSYEYFVGDDEKEIEDYYASCDAWVQDFTTDLQKVAEWRKIYGV